jgi:hypothetical protein
MRNRRYKLPSTANQADFDKLLKRFYAIKHRCGRDPYYRHVKFDFMNAREAAMYTLAACGPLLPAPEQPVRRDGVANGAVKYLTIDRVDGRRGYERGNLRYATTAEQLANRRFKSRWHPFADFSGGRIELDGPSPCR